MVFRVALVTVLVAGLCVASPSSVDAFAPPEDVTEITPTGNFRFKFHINFWSAAAKVGETYNGVDIYSVPCKTAKAEYADATHCSVCGLEGERALPGLEDCGHTSDHGAGHLDHDNFETTLCFNPEFQARDVSAGHDNYGHVPHEINTTPNIIDLFDGPGAFYGEYDQDALRVDNWQWAVPLWLYKQDNCHKHSAPDTPTQDEEDDGCDEWEARGCCEKNPEAAGCTDTDPDDIPPPPGDVLLACNAGDGFRGAADDVLRVNIADRLIAEHGRPDSWGNEDRMSVPPDVSVSDLTVEARWKLSHIKGNDDVPTSSRIRIGTVSTQGHRLFIDNDATGGAELVYRPKRWAAGFDRFVYAYPELECAATVTIIFTDSPPVSVPAFDAPDETVSSVRRYSWIKAEGSTHKHARAEQRLKHVTRRVQLYTHRCVFASDFFTRPGGVFDNAAYQAECFETVHYTEPETVIIVEEVEDLYRWAYADAGVRRNVDVQHFSGRFRLHSGAGSPYRYPTGDGGFVAAPDDYDADLWHGGYLYHDPETGELPPLEGDHGAFSGFLLTRDVAGPAGGDIVWRYINYPGTPGGNQTRDIINHAVTFDGVHPVSPGIVRPSPRLNHLEYHQNLRPPGHRVHVIPDEYVEGWYYRRDRHHPTRWHDQCGNLPGTADGITQICLIARNSQPNQIISDELTDDGANVKVRYWVCDRRIEAYWADRAAANAEGFNAYDYCSRNTHTIGYVPQPGRAYPN